MIKKLTGHESNIILGTVYIPGETSTYYCKDAYDTINNECINYFYNKNNIILGGDFNSRSSTLNDCILHDELDFDNNTNNDILESTNIFFQYHKIPTQRFNQDYRKVNTNGKKLIDFCQNTNFKILNGRCGSDKGIGRATCNDASVNDYVLLHVNTLIPIINFEVNDFSPFLSDVHCPISICLACKTVYTNNTKKTNTNRDILDQKMTNIQVPKNWENDNVELYKLNLKAINTNEIIQKLNKIESEVNPPFDYLQEEINNTTKFLSDILIKAAKDANGMKIINNNPNMRVTERKHNENNKDWFDETCKNYRTIYHKCKKEYNLDKTLENYNKLKLSSKHYKKVMNQSIKNHKKDKKKN